MRLSVIPPMDHLAPSSDFGAKGNQMTKRQRLPDERPGTCHKFEILGEKITKTCPHCGKEVDVKETGCEGYLHINLKEDGTPGEIFLTLSKVGETRRGFADSWAKAISIALQYGAPLKELIKSFRSTRFEPFGYVKGYPGIKQTNSIIDFVCQVLEDKFCEKGEKDGA